MTPCPKRALLFLHRGNRKVLQGARCFRRGGGRAELCSARGAGGVRLHRQRQGDRFAVGPAHRHQVPVHTGGQARLAYPHAPAEDGQDGEYMERSVVRRRNKRQTRAVVFLRGDSLTTLADAVENVAWR